MGMKGHRRLGLSFLAVVLVAAVGAVTAATGKASTIERSGTITCTFIPQQPYTAYSGQTARTSSS